MPSDARGRPRTSSRAALEEAATELFLEQGYQHTTIEQIATRAGVSRATFFNYFSAKSDVLWLQVDEALGVLEEAIWRGLSLAEALAEVAETLALRYPPLIASQAEAMKATQELQDEAGKRVVWLARSVAQGIPNPERTWIVTGAIVQAVLAWVEAGVDREHPAHYLNNYADLVPELGE